MAPGAGGERSGGEQRRGGRPVGGGRNWKGAVLRCRGRASTWTWSVRLRAASESCRVPARWLILTNKTWQDVGRIIFGFCCVRIATHTSPLTKAASGKLNVQVKNGGGGRAGEGSGKNATRPGKGTLRPESAPELIKPLTVNFSGSSFAPDVGPHCYFLRRQFAHVQYGVRTFPSHINK